MPMSVARLTATSAVMAAVAAVLGALAPAPADLLATVGAGQRTVDAAGPDALVVAAAALLGWLVWAWGALGLLLTAVSGVPGLVGDISRLVLRCLLPAGARRAAVIALGLGLGVAGPVAAVPVLAVPVASAAPSAAAVPDWPAAGPESSPLPTAVPDWPAPTGRVVVRGDCLWDLAASWLRDRNHVEPSTGEIASAVAAWWAANADVIGTDPDLLLPGQVLVPPP
jgi:nucleoid-associated protein YgaU